MSFWNSNNLPTYNLKGGSAFMLPQAGFTSDFRPGGTFLSLPHPSTSTPDMRDEKTIRDTTKRLTKLTGKSSDSSDSSDSESFISKWWSKIFNSKVLSSMDKKILKEKYLKYKNKYLNLKNKESN